MIRKRFAVFQQQTMAVVQHYDRLGRVFRIDGAPAPGAVFEASLRAVEPVVRKEVLGVVSRLLDAVDRLDWPAYAELCREDMTAIEDESRGALVRGLDFHRFYFDEARKAGAKPGGRRSALLSPSVDILSPSVAVVTYTRAVQSLSGTDTFAETRVMQREEAGWRCAHFHRSTIETADDGSAAGFADDVAAEAVEDLRQAADEAQASLGRAVRDLRSAARA